MRCIVTIDDAGGTMFNGRRQSRDRVLCAWILGHTEGPLWMSGYSAPLFEGAAGAADRISVSEKYLELAGEEEWCLVEGDFLAPYADRIRRMVVCRWNRRYPADRKLDLIPAEPGWQLVRTEEVAGSSHEAITIETWDRADQRPAPGREQSREE